MIRPAEIRVDHSRFSPGTPGSLIASALQLTGIAGPDAAKALAQKVLDALDANGFQITRAQGKAPP